MSNAPSKPTSGTLERPHMPYMDGILADLASGEKEEVDVLWQRHLHWGYWADPTTADGSVEDYAAASERLAQLHFDVANIKDGMRVVDCGCGVGGAIDSMNVSTSTSASSRSRAVASTRSQGTRSSSSRGTPASCPSRTSPSMR